MVRRTISLSASVDEKIRKVAEDEGSYSAAVARLVEEGAKRTGKNDRPSWIGSGDGPRDLGRNAEKYLREPVRRNARRR
jgi:hypothetical protein